MDKKEVVEEGEEEEGGQGEVVKRGPSIGEVGGRQKIVCFLGVYS